VIRVPNISKIRLISTKNEEVRYERAQNDKTFDFSSLQFNFAVFVSIHLSCSRTGFCHQACGSIFEEGAHYGS
jgi:hypothetical protein